MKASEINTLDDLSNFITKEIGDTPTGYTEAMSGNFTSDKIRDISKIVGAKIPCTAKLENADGLEKMAKDLNQYITSTKSEWNNLLKEIRDSRMAVSTEAAQITRLIESLEQSRAKAEAFIAVAEKLKAVLNDPALKGFLK
jgi:predicted  nucleic acid-binding Zn-ribbon protein